MAELSNCSIDLDSLPSPSGVALKLLEMFRETEIDKDELVKVIGTDVALSSKIIAYCNSPVLRRSQEIRSLDHAVVALGLKKVRTIALSFSLIDPSGGKTSKLDYDSFWSRSLAIALSTQVLCGRFKENPEMGFLTGLVLNCGELALQMDSLSGGDQIPELQPLQAMLAEERERFGADRFALSVAMLEAWKFPEEILSVIREIAAGEIQSDIHRCLELGWRLGVLISDPSVDDAFTEEIRTTTEAYLGDAEAVDELFDLAVARWIEMSGLLKIKCDSPSSLREIENEARRAVVSISLTQFDEQQIIERENESLVCKTLTDELTGLHNRRAMDFHLEREVERCKRYEGDFAIAMIDIDHFKAINDTYGHPTGDEVLKQVADVLKLAVRRSDLICRYGGEEFFVMMTDCNLSGAMEIAERLREDVAALEICQGDAIINVTVSIGIASFLSQSRPTPADLISAADRQLYQAKNSGRNCCAG